MTTKAIPRWRFHPKTPKNGYVTSTRLFLRDFDVIVNINGKFSKYQSTIDKRLTNKLRSTNGFRYANIYDIEDHVQIASVTPTKFKWLVKYVDDLPTSS